MKAFIKKDKWETFIENWLDYGFVPTPINSKKPSVYKKIDNLLYLIIDVPTRELMLITPYGSSPFMETQTQHFQDLIDAGFIEFVKGKFD